MAEIDINSIAREVRFLIADNEDEEVPEDVIAYFYDQTKSIKKTALSCCDWLIINILKRPTIEQVGGVKVNYEDRVSALRLLKNTLSSSSAMGGIGKPFAGGLCRPISSHTDFMQ